MKRHIITLLLLVLTAVSLISCKTEPAAAQKINLNHLEPLPKAAATGVMPLRVAIAAVISPKGNVDSYSQLLDYLSQKTNRPVELIQRRTYAEINDLIEQGEVDIAFVCTSAYVMGKREFDMQLLVAPQVEGETTYHSLLIVPADSPAQSMADLKGKVFAFTDPISNTGRNYPVFLVNELGETPETFFSQTFFTYSHDDAIRAVAGKMADGAAVDSLVYNYAIKRQPDLAEKVKVIHQSPPFGIPPVVVSPHVRPQLRTELQQILLEIDNDPGGRATLQLAGIDQFVLVEDSIYDSVRNLEAQVSRNPKQ